MSVDVLLAHRGKGEALVFRRRVEFRKAIQSDSKMDALRKKYKPINDLKELRRLNGAATAGAGRDGDSKGKDGLNGLVDPSGFRRPATVLFPKERLTANWKKIRPIGAGLQNLGNTCFLNSALQCLTYTAPLAEYFLHRGHSRSCRVGETCIACRLEAHVNSALRKGGSGVAGAFAPKMIVGRLKAIAKHMRVGRQEDAHEFIRYLIEGMQRNVLHGQDPKIDTRVQETTSLYQIFGGYLQSQVVCSQCNHSSNTFDPCLDISLDIHRSSTLEKALSRFVKPDLLLKANRYRCEKCNKLVDASKRMTVYQLPSVMTIQLKRFSSWTGGKINQHVEFPKTLNMKPYLSCNSPDAGPFDYNLYAVLVHAGGSARSGHYYAFVKSPGGVWYEMNDSMVTQASERRVLQASAYLLFYQRSSILPDQSGSAGAQKRAAESLAESAAALLAAQAKMCGEHSASAAELGADSGSTAIATVAKDNNRNQEEPEHLGRHRDSSKQNCQKSPKRPRKGNRDEIDQLFDRQRKTSTTARPESPDQFPSSPAKVNLIESLAKRRPTSGEWVVKDKPTQDPATVSSAATVVRWDESNKSKLEKASLLSVRTSTAPTTDIDPDSKGRLKDSQFSVRVATWDDQESPDASSSAAAERKGVIRSLGNATKHLKRRPDTWDVEYDRGKVKKARKDKGVVLQQSNTNPFQVVSERKSGPGKEGGAKKRKAKKHKHKKQKRQ